MGAPDPGMEAAEQPAAETLLTAFKTISAAERRKHASVLNYWLSIRGDKEFPPLHDFDPLEISDFGPSSLLLELIGGGHDGEIRHLGEALKGEVTADKIIDAPNPSLLASIAKKLPIVAISRDFLAFEDEFSTDEASTRCWVTLLPLSSGGAWVDYAYALVSIESEHAEIAEPVEAPVEDASVEELAVDEAEEPRSAEPAEALVDDAPVEEPTVVEAEEPQAAVEEPVVETENAVGEVAEVEPEAPETTAEEMVEPSLEQEPEPEEELAKSGPGFARLFEGFAGLTGFYGHSVKVEQSEAVDSDEAGEQPAADAPAGMEQHAEEPPAEELVAVEEAAEEIEPPIGEPEAIEDTADEPLAVEAPAETPEAGEPVADVEQSVPALEGNLQSKLAEVRAMADEARMAKLRANAALYEGLGAAYDFALDAEDSPEDYLRLVEAQGLKIQLRSPMKPVVKLAFDGLCDDSTIGQLEAVLAWALKEELPRGTLAARIEEAGGIARILNA